MKVLFVLPLAGVLFSVEPAHAQRRQPVSADYSCSCEKKSEKIKHPCQASGGSVTVESIGTDETRAKAAATKCAKLFGASCPAHSCRATATMTARRDGGQPEPAAAPPARQVGEKDTGISDEHADALAKYAEHRGVTIIVRTTNVKSLPYQDKDRDKYRPKPLALSALSTEPSGRNAGLIVKPDFKRLIQAEDQNKTEAAVDEEIRQLKEDCKKVKAERRRESKCGWYLDNHGVLRDEKKRAVFGDYDLQGVYEGTTLVDTNDTKVGNAERLALNTAIDKTRQRREDWMVQHGGNDNYTKKGGVMGRQPRMDEDFMVFEPDGNRRYIENLTALKAYYDQRGFVWLYECPDAAKCKAATR